jgi:L-fucose mutarotase
MLKGIHPLLHADLLHALAAMGHGDAIAIVAAPEDIPAPVAEFAAVFTAHGLADLEIGRLPREAFYARAREAFAIVRTGELRGYGNILLLKGVLEERSAHGPGPVR